MIEIIDLEHLLATAPLVVFVTQRKQCIVILELGCGELISL